jgi:hypothetical protein
LRRLSRRQKRKRRSRKKAKMRRNKDYLIEFIKFFFDCNIFKAAPPSGFFFVFPCLIQE